MKKYLVKSQKEHEERDFVIIDLETEEEFTVDLYTNGNFNHPEGVDATQESWRKWLHDFFVGKTIEIEMIHPINYQISGKANIITSHD